MSEVTIQIQLTHSEASTSAPTYRPGEMITGMVAVQAARDVPPQNLLITVNWTARGRLLEPQTVARQSHPLQMTAGESKTFPFSFQLPEQPWSYTGKRVHVAWHIEAYLEQSKKIKPATHSFTVAPTRATT